MRFFFALLGPLFFMMLYFLSHHIELQSGIEHALFFNAIEERKIICIPNYPAAFNPSLASQDNGFLLSFRINYNLNRLFNLFLKQPTSFVGILRCDENFQPQSAPQILPLPGNPQDARLIRYQERLFLFYNDEGRMYLAELVDIHNHFHISSCKPLTYSEATQQVEKNWSPFVFQDTLYAIYQPSPHTILQVDVESGLCHCVSSSDARPLWRFGAMRGGTPALLLDAEYITFFHSHVPAKTYWPKKRRIYLMAAYTFASTPPFQMRKISKLPIAAESDYDAINPKKILFPTGFLIQNKTLYLSYGLNDNKICVAKINADTLLDSMETIP